MVVRQCGGYVLCVILATQMNSEGMTKMLAFWSRMVYVLLVTAAVMFFIGAFFGLLGVLL